MRDIPTGYVPKFTQTSQTNDSITYRVEAQPAPTPNAHPAVWPLVMVDMAGRDKLGRERYGTPLQPHNGRDALRDAYEEALDLAVYLRTAIFERDGA